jgi:hypothetical protein
MGSSASHCQFAVRLVLGSPMYVKTRCLRVSAAFRFIIEKIRAVTRKRKRCFMWRRVGWNYREDTTPD